MLQSISVNISRYVHEDRRKFIFNKFSSTWGQDRFFVHLANTLWDWFIYLFVSVILQQYVQSTLWNCVFLFRAHFYYKLSEEDWCYKGFDSQYNCSRCIKALGFECWAFSFWSMVLWTLQLEHLLFSECTLRCIWSLLKSSPNSTLRTGICFNEWMGNIGYRK